MLANTLNPEPQRLLEDLILLEHTDPGAQRVQMSTNSYILLGEGKSLVVDAAFTYLLTPVRQIAREGYSPAGLILSHRHLAGNGDLFGAFEEEFGVPIFMHPLDASHRQARSAGVAFQDPMANPVFAEFGLDVIHFPGQTEGSVMLYRERDGLILSGDSAMGTTRPQAAQGIERLIRPPVFTSDDDEELRQNWLGFKRPVSHVGPYHGSAYVGHAERGYTGRMREIMRPLTRKEPTKEMEG